MRRRSNPYANLVLISSLIMIGIAFLAVLVFQETGAIKSRSILQYLFIAAVYGVAMNLVLGRFSKWFRFDFNLVLDKSEEYDDAILTAGKVPLQSMIIFLGISFIFAVIVGLTGDFYGLAATGRAMFTLFITSLGMMIAGFVFVIGNVLLSKYLTEFKLIRFPLGFTYRRKSLGDFTVPFFMTMTTFLFTYSVQALLTSQLGQRALIKAGLIASCVVFLVAATVCALILGRLTNGVFSSIISQLRQMTSGEKDLSGRIMISSVDELGLISAFVNEFNGNLALSIDELKGSQKKLSGLGEELTQSAVASASAISQIASNIEAVGEKVLEQSGSVNESSSAVEEIAMNIESLDSLVKDQADSVSKASASIEEMVANISTITASFNKIASQFGSLLTATGDGKEALTGSSNRIQLIAERSNMLLEANKVIATIASQTNLLAMNAAIEAAHAGDAGRGFSVVADEIRHLAETSAIQSKKISQEIKAVQKAINDVVLASHGTEDSFNLVVTLVGETDSLVREVNAAMQEQKTGSLQILEALGSMNTITTQVRESSREMSAGNTTVLAEITRLKDSTELIKASMEQMGIGARGIDSYAKKVSELSKGTKETIETVESAVGCFRT